MKRVLLIKNLNTEEHVNMIKEKLDQTRVVYEVNLLKKCVVVYGDYDMANVARKELNELGFIIL